MRPEDERHSNHWSRRGFLRRAAGAAASLAVAPPAAALAALGRPPASSNAPAPRRPARPRGALPPQTVGLRSLGGDFLFDPPGLGIEPGDGVHWLNIGDFHTVSAFHPAHARLLPGEVPLRIPEGAEPFHSGTLGLDAGNHFFRRFEIEGVYDYFCQPHYSFGMVGRIVAGGPRGGPAVRRPDAELVEAARGRLPAVETIAGPSGRAFAWSARLNGVLLLRAGRRAGTEVPAGDHIAAARAVAEGARADERLLGLLDSAGARSAFLQALDRFTERAGDTSYDELVSLSDAVRAPLRRALGAE